MSFIVLFGFLLFCFFQSVKSSHKTSWNSIAVSEDEGFQWFNFFFNSSIKCIRLLLSKNKRKFLFCFHKWSFIFSYRFFWQFFHILWISLDFFFFLNYLINFEKISLILIINSILNNIFKNLTFFIHLIFLVLKLLSSDIIFKIKVFWCHC